MTTKIWITRTEPAAIRSAAAWRKAGFLPVVAPLLTIHPVAQKRPVSDEAVLIFTSGHGVRHCGIRGDHRTVYAVGAATAQLAREHGFQTVVAADGDWETLVQAVEKTQNPVVHISGKKVRGAVVETLRARGFEAQRRIVYDAKPQTEWPLDSDDVDGVALYSPMASSTLMALPARQLTHLTAYCLSPNVAAPLRGPRVRIAKRPTEAALIACSRPAEA